VPELGHGVLAYALLSGLGDKGKPKAPTTTDGIATVFSLLQYVNQQVPELTEKYHRGDKQYPVSSNTGMDFPDVLQLSGLPAGDVKQSRNDNPTGDLQMAADRTRHHPLCRPVVSALLSFATRG